MIYLLTFLLNSIQLVTANCLISPLNPINQTHIILSKFNTFNELDFNKCKTKSFYAMSIIPNCQLLLDDSLNFTGLHIKHTGENLIFN